MYDLDLVAGYGLDSTKVYNLVISTKLHPTIDGFTYGATDGPGLYGKKTDKEFILEIYDGSNNLQEIGFLEHMVEPEELTPLTDSKVLFLT